VEALFLHGWSGGKFPSYYWATGASLSRNGSFAALTVSIYPWDGDPTTRGYRLTSHGEPQPLADLGDSTANAISADGAAVVGSAFGVWWAPIHHAFWWTEEQHMVDLGVLPGAWSSDGYAVSGDGSTAAGQVSGNWPVHDHAFLWTASSGMLDLNAYLPSQGVDLTGWVLTSAKGLNDNGSVIVGDGIHNGQVRGWRATVRPRRSP
jgi:probable HAF family extracellular repeat protein